LAISTETLANWVRAARDGKREKVEQNQKPLTDIEAELGPVKRDMAEGKTERDLFKQFATYCAKESR
jgi:transposase